MVLNSYLPAETVWSPGRIIDLQGGLFDVEHAVIESAVLRRQQEFRAGRTCARNAMKSLGIFEQPIMKRHDRSPDWPTGIVGSIAHSDSWAAAVIGKSDHFRGLGLDITEAMKMDHTLHPIILTQGERDRLPAGITLEDTSIDAACVVSAIKEAIFKAAFPVVHMMFDFLDAVVASPKTPREAFPYT